MFFAAYALHSVWAWKPRCEGEDQNFLNLKVQGTAGVHVCVLQLYSLGVVLFLGMCDSYFKRH